MTTLIGLLLVAALLAIVAGLGMLGQLAKREQKQDTMLVREPRMDRPVAKVTNLITNVRFGLHE